MKPKTSLILFLFAFSLIACSQQNSEKNYLKSVLNNLEKIQSATYYSSTKSWLPGDTAASKVQDLFIKEFDNPADSTIGASFIEFLQEDTTQMSNCYDGNMKAFVNKDTKTVSVDSFKNERFPFRLVPPPFFNYTKNILKYALETQDSILLQTEDHKKEVYFSLTIFEDTQIEFFGKPYRMPIYPDFYVEPTSKYELWIDKKTNLPYKYRREMSHNTITDSISNLKTGNITGNNIHFSDNFPAGYSIKIAGQGDGNVRFSKADLIGKSAPDWSLFSIENQPVGINNIHSKVVMLMFTSAGCGPCKIATPFLNELIIEYKKPDFQLVAIECATQSLKALKNYQQKNNSQYTLLQSNDDVKAKYGILGFPIFFILDKNKVVRKEINGYKKGTTENEIRKAIDELLN